MTEIIQDININTIRRQLRIRGLIRCRCKSELSYRPADPDDLVTCHLYHDKSDMKLYTDPDNYLMCTPEEHLAYHILFMNCPEEIGLTPNKNKSAIRLIFYDTIKYLKRKGIDCLSTHQIYKLIEDACNLWSYHLNVDFDKRNIEVVLSIFCQES